MVSSDSIIGRVFSNTRLQDTSYVADMLPWMSEAMALMRTKYQLIPVWKDIVIDFHKARLPAGLVYIDSVSHNGFKVRSKGGYMALDAPKELSFGTGIFVSDVAMVENTISHNNMYVGVINDLDLVPPSVWSDCEFYQVEGQYLSFSKKDGTLRIYFHSIPVDCNGFPLITDNEAYKEAIYWYIRMKIIETGYKDPVFSWDVCKRNWDEYAPRAIEQLLTPSMDEMNRRVYNIHGYIPPINFLGHILNTQ